MCSHHVHQLRPFRSAHVKCYGRAPEAAAPHVSSSMLPNGFEVLPAEAHGVEIHPGDEVGAASGPPARCLDHLSRARLLLAASARSSHLPTKRVQTAGKGGVFSRASFARTEKLKRSAPTNSATPDTMVRAFSANSAAFNPYQARQVSQLANKGCFSLKACTLTYPNTPQHPRNPQASLERITRMTKLHAKQGRARRKQLVPVFEAFLHGAGEVIGEPRA